MSNERSVEQVHREYSELCAKAGHLQYNISVLSSDLSLVNEQLKSLNLEAAALAAKSKESKGE